MRPPDSLAARLHRVGLRAAYRVMLVYWRVLRPRTSGACVAVWCEGRLLLVRHSYKRGYGVPAGGVRRGEPALRAAVRELREEVGIAATPADLRHAGHVVTREHGNEDHLDFFELLLEAPPALRVDGREVVWAGFHTREEALGLELLASLRRWLEDPAQSGEPTDSTV